MLPRGAWYLRGRVSCCIMACLFMSAVSKNLSERRSTKSDMSPVSLRSALPPGKSQNRVSQVLQVPPVSLYGPLRKKSLAKDLAHSESPGSTLLNIEIKYNLV